MFDRWLRIFKERLLAPLSHSLGPGVSPAALTLLALAAGIVATIAAYRGMIALSLAAWGSNRLLDGLDGTHARVQKRQSDFGGYLDIILDFVVYAAIPVALAAREPTLALPAVFLEATFFVNTASWMYLSALLEARLAGASARGEFTSVTMPPGVVAGTETVVFYALFLGIPSWRVALFWVMGVLVCVNIVQRLWWAKQTL